MLQLNAVREKRYHDEKSPKLPAFALRFFAAPAVAADCCAALASFSCLFLPICVASFPCWMYFPTPLRLLGRLVTCVSSFDWLSLPPRVVPSLEKGKARK